MRRWLANRIADVRYLGWVAYCRFKGVKPGSDESLHLWPWPVWLDTAMAVTCRRLWEPSTVIDLTEEELIG